VDEVVGPDGGPVTVTRQLNKELKRDYNGLDKTVTVHIQISL
jgi:hypothetical protein